MIKILLITGLFIVLFVSCDPLGSDGDGVDSFFHASISGELSFEIEGRSSFGTFTDPSTGNITTILFMIPANDQETGLNFSGLTPGPIQTQSYPITTNEELEELNINQFIASYTHNDEEYSETFRAQLGSVTFSNSTENVLNGSFSFEALGQRFPGSGEEVGDTVDVWISIEGQFTSVRGGAI